MSNLKQIGNAARMYEQDYDERVSPMYAGGNGGGRMWFQWLLQPYVKNFQVWVCPSYTGEAFQAPAWANVPGSTPCTSEPLSVRFRTGVGKTWFRLDGLGDAGYWNDNLKLAGITYPSELVEFVDSDCIVAGPHSPAEAPGFYAGTSWPAGYFRHNGGMNCSYMDGHAKWQKPGGLGLRNIYYAAP